MRLFAIGDTHLPSARNKSMEMFGWVDHPHRLGRAWDALVTPDDVVIVAGDISWATKPTEVVDDLKWIDARPGRKVFLKGNHDYWWGDSKNKLNKLLAEFPSFVGALNSTSIVVGGYVIAGTRLWTVPEAPAMPGGEMGNEDQNTGFVEREQKRLAASIADAEAKVAQAAKPLVKIAAVHFPPIYNNGVATVFSEPIEKFGPQVCVYGHLHGPGIGAGFVGVHGGVRYVLASCDAAGFSPVLLHEG